MPLVTEESHSQTLSLRSLGVLWSGSQAPEPHPLCPSVPQGSGLSEANGLAPEAAGPVHPGEPLRGKVSQRVGSLLLQALPTRQLCLGVLRPPSAPPQHPLPRGSLHGTLKRGLYVCVRSDHWEARGWGWLTG